MIMMVIIIIIIIMGRIKGGGQQADAPYFVSMNFISDETQAARLKVIY